MWSRLIWFPRIIASLILDIPFPFTAWQQIPCGLLLCVLLCLHVFWTALMFKVLYKAVFNKEKLADDRDKDVEMKEHTSAETKAENENDKDTVVEMETGRTDNVKMDEKPKMHRRQSSLMGSYILETELKEDINAQ